MNYRIQVVDASGGAVASIDFAQDAVGGNAGRLQVSGSRDFYRALMDALADTVDGSSPSFGAPPLPQVDDASRSLQHVLAACAAANHKRDYPWRFAESGRLDALSAWAPDADAGPLVVY